MQIAHRASPFLLAPILLAMAPRGAHTAPAAEMAILPPSLPWDGASRELVVAKDDPWITPCERSGLTRTPRYDETMEWLKRLDDASPQVSMVSLGVSPEGRDIWMVIASKDGASTPEELRRSGKPTLLAQAGIHAGEIDGKDAGLMFLRDITVARKKHDLLWNANFLFVPIFNVDGHERFSQYGRINQRGPEECGWRTNSRNLNLNRDYAKLDTPEMLAMVRALNAWDPELYLDLHVTDGVDYQYDITWGYTGRNGASPAAADWLDRHLTPALNRDLAASGHVPGPLIFAVDNAEMSRGIVDWTASPRFSNGYGAARHLPTVLVENHSLKPYEQRVLGTYVVLETSMRVLGTAGARLRTAIESDRRLRPEEIVLAWDVADAPFDSIDFLGVQSRLVASEVSGAKRVEWTGRPVALRIPFIPYTKPALSVTRPPAYWIPPAWTEVIERLEAHGIKIERAAEPVSVDVEMYRLSEPRLDPQPFEGHVRVSTDYSVEERTIRLPKGSVRVPTDQPLGDLAIRLLEPGAPDSFLQWGFFLEVLQATEYVEGYVMDPMAQRMLAQNDELRAEFGAALAADSAFAATPAERRQWFYRRTPFHDQAWRLYPVARER